MEGYNWSPDDEFSQGGEVETGGLKFRVLGDNSDDFKFKIKNKR